MYNVVLERLETPRDKSLRLELENSIKLESVGSEGNAGEAWRGDETTTVGISYLAPRLVGGTRSTPAFDVPEFPRCIAI